jgi:hypothetical protein
MGPTTVLFSAVWWLICGPIMCGAHVAATLRQGQYDRGTLYGRGQDGRGTLLCVNVCVEL